VLLLVKDNILVEFQVGAPSGQGQYFCGLSGRCSSGQGKYSCVILGRCAFWSRTILVWNSRQVFLLAKDNIFVKFQVAFLMVKDNTLVEFQVGVPFSQDNTRAEVLSLLVQNNTLKEF
jgi:hypothetical protein